MKWKPKWMNWMNTRTEWLTFGQINQFIYIQETKIRKIQKSLFYFG
jgi:hypothetical protein